MILDNFIPESLGAKLGRARLKKDLREQQMIQGPAQNEAAETVLRGIAAENPETVEATVQSEAARARGMV